MRLYLKVGIIREVQTRRGCSQGKSRSRFFENAQRGKGFSYYNLPTLTLEQGPTHQSCRRHAIPGYLAAYGGELVGHGLYSLILLG